MIVGFDNQDRLLTHADNLFFFKEHEQQLKEAGFEIERLDKPDATEELIQAVKGKDRWYCMNTSITIPEAGAKLMSDTATQSLIHVLETGNDTHLVNPEYLQAKNS